MRTGWSSDLLRFALLSDPHVMRGTKPDQPLSRARLENVIAAVNAEQVSFVLCGDNGRRARGGRELADFPQRAGPRLFVTESLPRRNSPGRI